MLNNNRKLCCFRERPRKKRHNVASYILGVILLCTKSSLWFEDEDDDASASGGSSLDDDASASGPPLRAILSGNTLAWYRLDLGQESSNSIDHELFESISKLLYSYSTEVALLNALNKNNLKNISWIRFFLQKKKWYNKTPSSLLNGGSSYLDADTLQIYMIRAFSSPNISFYDEVRSTSRSTSSLI